MSSPLRCCCDSGPLQGVRHAAGARRIGARARQPAEALRGLLAEDARGDHHCGTAGIRTDARGRRVGARTMNKCPSCGGFMLKDETLCARCERLTAIGTIVGALLRLADGALCDDALEALGFLLRERSKLASRDPRADRGTAVRAARRARRLCGRISGRPALRARRLVENASKQGGVALRIQYQVTFSL
jgi:hypothetical protein